MYESEKEAKRLESEQSQLPTTTSTDKQQVQQQVVPTPAFLNGFTLETSLISDRSLLDDKSKGKSKPVSTKPIPGTPW